MSGGRGFFGCSRNGFVSFFSILGSGFWRLLAHFGVSEWWLWFLYHVCGLN